MKNTGLENLDMLARGAVTERFGMELDAVLRNIIDPNTKAGATRTITLKVSFKPDDQRQSAMLSIEAKSALAPAVPVTTMLLLGMEADGTVTATELGRETPGQIDMEGNVFEPRTAGLTVIGG